VVLGGATVKEENGHKEYDTKTPLLLKTDASGNVVAKAFTAKAYGWN
jgi:hypothetical protein